MRRIAPFLLASVLLAAGCAVETETVPTVTRPATTQAVPGPSTTIAATTSATTTTVPPPPPSTTEPPGTAEARFPTVGSGTWERWTKTNFVRPEGIAIAPDGAVWAITTGGLVRWDPDGSYTELADPAWPDPTPQSLVVAPDGAVWIGFHIDVFRIDGSGSTRHTFPPGDSNWGAIDLDIGADGAVWAASNQLGVRRFASGEWEVVSASVPGDQVDTFAVDRDGRAWVGSYWNGLWVLERDDWRREHGRTTRRVRTAPDGDLWYVTDGGHAEDTVVTHVDRTGDVTEYPLGATSVWEIVPHEDGTYIGTNTFGGTEPHGLWRLIDGEREPVVGPWDESRRQILGVAMDTTGGIWLGGQSGLWHYDGTAARHYVTDTVAGYSVGFVHIVDDQVWAGDCGGSSLYIDGRWRELPAPDEDLAQCESAVGADGTLWLAGWNGIAHFDGAGWVIDRSDATGASWIDRYPVGGEDFEPEDYWRLAATPDAMWAAMFDVEQALWRYDGDGWYPVRNVLPTGSGGIVGLDVDLDGALWVATHHGVHRRTTDGMWTMWWAGGAGPPDWVRAIGVGGGSVWVAASGEVASFDGPNWVRYLDEEWYEPRILAVDDDGGMWRPAAGGAARFDGAETERLSLPGGAWLEAMTIAEDGSWWLAGYQALYRWIP